MGGALCAASSSWAHDPAVLLLHSELNGSFPRVILCSRGSKREQKRHPPLSVVLRRPAVLCAPSGQRCPQAVTHGGGTARPSRREAGKFLRVASSGSQSSLAKNLHSLKPVGVLGHLPGCQHLWKITSKKQRVTTLWGQAPPPLLCAGRGVDSPAPRSPLSRAAAPLHSAQS